jgi:hypothetical protein
MDYHYFDQGDLQPVKSNRNIAIKQRGQLGLEFSLEEFAFQSLDSVFDRLKSASCRRSEITGLFQERVLQDIGIVVVWQ